MNSNHTESQRHFSRVPFQAPVHLYLENRTLEVTLLDIALKGALVRLPEPLEVALQTKCRLLLPLNNDDEGIEMHGHVVHLEDQNLGMACEDIDVLSLTRLRRLLELNTGDPDLMDRELSLLFGKH